MKKHIGSINTVYHLIYFFVLVAMFFETCTLYRCAILHFLFLKRPTTDLKFLVQFQFLLVRVQNVLKKCQEQKPPFFFYNYSRNFLKKFYSRNLSKKFPFFDQIFCQILSNSSLGIQNTQFFFQ